MTASPATARVAAPAVRLQPRPRAKPAAGKRPVARRRRLTGGVVWIVVTAVLLAGVVALNVAVLQLNLGLDRLGRERVKLKAENAALASELSSASAAAKIEALARQRLGLVPAQAGDTVYVRLAGK